MEGISSKRAGKDAFDSGKIRRRDGGIGWRVLRGRDLGSVWIRRGSLGKGGEGRLLDEGGERLSGGVGNAGGLCFLKRRGEETG